jgi:hypothetical protein
MTEANSQMPHLKLDAGDDAAPVATCERLDMDGHVAVRAINDLQTTFLQFSKVTDQRLTRMENNISQIMGLLSHEKPSTLEWTDFLNDQYSPGDRMPTFMSTSPVTQPLHPLPLALPFEEEQPTSSSDDEDHTPSSLTMKLVGLETKWYTKRSLTPFQVHLVDSAGDLYTKTDGYILCVHLLSGHGVQVDHYLANAEALQFPFVDGIADVAGLRFLAVSSRNGGHFRFQFTTKGNIPVNALNSEELHVLSERLKNEHKAESILDLGPDDPLVRVPGIGKKYAAKLSEQGLVTVRDLADIDSSPSARGKRLDILNSVRKDRGALTEAKLVELLRDARTVVKRDSGMEDDEVEEPPAKRQKIVETFQFKPLTDMDLPFDASMLLNPHAFEPALSFDP